MRRFDPDPRLHNINDLATTSGLWSYSRNGATLLSFTARSWALLTFGTGRFESVSHGKRNASSEAKRSPRTHRADAVRGTRRRAAFVLP
jgi:hypothetical protein